MVQKCSRLAQVAKAQLPAHMLGFVRIAARNLSQKRSSDETVVVTWRFGFIIGM